MEKEITFREWAILSKFSSNTENLDMIGFTNPGKIGKFETPKDLNSMTIGQMVELSTCKNGIETFYKACEVLVKMSRKEVDESKATEVVRFVGWVVESVKKINDMFDRIKIKPSSEQQRAGIEDLNFGIFGLVDWYAKRMGITDHEDVMSVTWVRVYKCLEMDNKTSEFQKRLIKVYEDEHRG